MKRIEDIKKFEDIDTYYEISKIVEEVFQDRVEAHKHLVTANKEIERLNELVKGLREERDYLFNKTTTESNYEIERLKKRLEEAQIAFLQVDKDKQRLNNIINEFDKFLFGELQTYGGGGLVQEYYNKFQELKGSDKE